MFSWWISHVTLTYVRGKSYEWRFMWTSVSSSPRMKRRALHVFLCSVLEIHAVTWPRLFWPWGPVSVSVCSADNTEASVTLLQRAFAKKPNRMRSVVTALGVAFKDCPSGYFCKCVTPTLASWHISITIISITVFLNKAILYAADDTTQCRKFSTHFRKLQFSWWRAIAWHKLKETCSYLRSRALDINLIGVRREKKKE